LCRLYILRFLGDSKHLLDPGKEEQEED